MFRRHIQSATKWPAANTRRMRLFIPLLLKLRLTRAMPTGASPVIGGVALAGGSGTLLQAFYSVLILASCRTP